MERIWAAGDVIEVKYAMQLRSASSGDNRVAYTFGPWLLGAPASDNSAYFNELTVKNKLIPAANRGCRRQSNLQGRSQCRSRPPKSATFPPSIRISREKSSCAP